MANFEAIRNQPLISEQGTVCQMHMLSLYCVFVMELEILQYTANFSHSSFLNWHFFFGKLQRQCYAIRTWLFWFLCQNTTLEFLANPRIFLLVHTTAATAACPIIEFFFLMPPNNNNRISNEYKKCLSLSLSSFFFIWTIVGFPFSFSNI